MPRWRLKTDSGSSRRSIPGSRLEMTMVARFSSDSRLRHPVVRDSGIKGQLPIRDVSLFVEVIGRGTPLLLMHGGPSADHWSLRPLRQCADAFTLVFYDHRCN